MNLRQQVRLLMVWGTLYLQIPTGCAASASDTSSKIRLEKRWGTLQVKPKITVSVSLGNATELRCRNETSEDAILGGSCFFTAGVFDVMSFFPDFVKLHFGSVMWWQTPFGSFGGRYKFSNKDPIEMFSGNLRISKVTLSHTGLYSCQHVDSRGTTAISYRLNVLSEKTHEIKTRMRTAREAVKSTSHYSDTDLAAAVSSSVLISFLGAFTLGALSQPYVMKCLQRARTSIRLNKSSRPDTTRVSKLGTVIFRRNPNSEEETVDFVPEPSASTLASSHIKTDQDESHQEENSNSINPTSNELANDKSDQTNNPEREKQKSGLESEPITSAQPKRVSRVIKLYNYDEDGNRYSHIKEPEDNPTPRQRAMSLTRLQSIINEVETPDFSSSRDTTQPDEALSLT